ncbi:carbohydrate ABC transporter permease [Mycobacterium sp. KBS0706]|uniref:carbohydrate ABC transporter permease n=1 Tax=Mycobacterium sp. KBS0706 TaxID=2578109 RepID=UPI001C8F9177|nr:carbohydrate ABC transporter permease [Mycobacterium sp. KBS0706]
MPRSIGSRRRWGTLLLTGGMAPVALLWLAPLYLMVIFSTLPDYAIFSPELPLTPGDNFFTNLAFLDDTASFGRAMLNSIGIAIVSAALSLMLTSMAGYAFARFQFVGKQATFSLLVATLTVPYAVVIIPQYVLVARDLGLSNTWIAVIVPPLFNSIGVLFMRQTFLSLPQELLDAARIDGAREGRIFFTIALPLVRPSMAALAIILFLASWNNYLWPLLVATESAARTAPVALGSLIGLNVVPWGALMVGAMLLTLPMLVVFIFLQRYFVAGITAGAVK